MRGIHDAEVKRKRGDSVRYFSDDARLKTSVAGVYLLGVVATVVLSAAIVPAGEPSSSPRKVGPPVDTARTIVDVVTKLGREWQKSARDVGHVKGLVNVLVATSEKMPAQLRPMLQIYQARGLVLLGRSADARSTVERGLRGKTDAPDFLLLAAQMGPPGEADKGKWHRDMLYKLGGILPLSIFGTGRDSRRSGGMLEYTNPGPPQVPVSSNTKAFVQIGDILAENGACGELSTPGWKGCTRVNS